MSSETRNLDFKRRIHYEANKYLDILTIMQQLERNGFIDRFYELLSSVYESEHNFTISELRKVAKKAKENKEVFDFMDHYSSNTSIFKQNLASILEMFVETIWNAKFQKVYQTIQESSPEDFEAILDPKNSSLQKAVASSDLIKSLRPDLTSYFASKETKGSPPSATRKEKNGPRRNKSEERSLSPPKLEGGWEKPTYKYGTESRDQYKFSVHPGPGQYSPQVDRQGTLTFGKKTGKTPVFTDKKATDPKALAKSLKQSKLG